MFRSSQHSIDLGLKINDSRVEVGRVLNQKLCIKIKYRFFWSWINLLSGRYLKVNFTQKKSFNHQRAFTDFNLLLYSSKFTCRLQKISTICFSTESAEGEGEVLSNISGEAFSYPTFSFILPSNQLVDFS